MVGQTHIYGSSYLREFTDFTVGKILVKYGDTMVGEFWNPGEIWGYNGWWILK